MNLYMLLSNVFNELNPCPLKKIKNSPYIYISIQVSVSTVSKEMK